MKEPNIIGCDGGEIPSDGSQTDVNTIKKYTNLSGLKNTLHGISYQLKLGIVVCLANIKKLMDPTTPFQFNITAEDSAGGKFDDIVYKFQDGEAKGTLKIQAKHKIGPGPHNIKIEEFITTKEKQNPFAILKYFGSFYDQESLTTDMEGLIICTNACISESDADKMWKKVQNADSLEKNLSLNRYVSAIFASVGGMCYQLDHEKLVNSKKITLYQSLKNYSKRTRLARLLVNATKSPKQEITLNNALLKEYHLAILSIIEMTDTSTNGSHRFKKEFLDSSFVSSTTGYDEFRKEFEVHYRQEFPKESSNVWEELDQKPTLYVAKSFLSSPPNASTATPCKSYFPDDNVDEYINTFCDRFRLVCGTASNLDEPIVNLWSNWCYGDDLSTLPDTGTVEASVASENLFKRTFNWLEEPYAKPLDSDDIRNTLQTVDSDLAFVKLKGISNNRQTGVVKSPFRIQLDILKDFDLYQQLETDSFVELEAYDVQFSATVISDILDAQGKCHYNTLFLEDWDFINNSKSVEVVFRSNKYAKYLVIVCRELFVTVKHIVKKWKKDILKRSEKQVILISKSSNTCDELAHFCFDHLDESRSSFFSSDNEISLYNTTISPAMLFKNVFKGQSIDNIIKALDKGEQMEENNAIVKNYRRIENIYVQRIWITAMTKQNPSLKRVWANREDMLNILENIRDDPNKEIEFMDLTRRIKKGSMFTRVYGSINEQEEVCLLEKDRSKKVMILLGEAGCGKSTNLTWLAWHTQKQNPSSWIIRCNLPDHCIDFKRLNEDQAGTITEDKALRILYELVYLSVVDLRDEALETKKLIARKCSECITFSKRKVVLSNELINEKDLSLDNIIHLIIFQEIFNGGELLLFFDGFDEIVPHYKEVVLNLICQYAQFNGVNKLYLTSRPYNFKDQFRVALKRPSYYQLKPLAMQEKGLILYKMLESKLYQKHMRRKQISDLYKALCVTLLCHLGQMSDVTLNLMSSVAILVELATQYIRFSSKRINVKLFGEMETKFRPSFIVEEFVKTKIRNTLYDKIGAYKWAEANPLEIERFENAIDDAKLKHGLLGIWVLFDEKEREELLSQNELLEAKHYMHNIEEAKEKVGIIDRIQEDVPFFIHRTFAEYLAAWWIFVRRIKCSQPENKNTVNLQTFWNKERRELQKYVDTILAKHFPLHLAIVEGDLQTTKSLLSTNSCAFEERDAGGRSILHLLACYTSFNECSKHLPAFITSDVVNAKDIVYGWTALDFAFQVNNVRFAFYLMHQGASINADVIYGQVVSSREDNVYRAAIYAKYVMEYLSREAIRYESHDNYKTIKEFSHQAAQYLTNETSIDKRMSGFPYYRMDRCLLKLSEKDRKVLNIFVHHDSFWMLESMTQLVDEQVYTTKIMRNTLFGVALEVDSVFILKYCLENDPSLVSESVLQTCLEKCIIENYKNEFKWFFDCYCSRIGIQDYQPGSIRCDDDTNIDMNLIFQPSYDDDVWKVVPKIDRIISKTPTEITMDNTLLKLLSLLVLIVASGRPSILRYLIVSCQLKLDASLIYYLACIVENYFKEVERHLIEFFIPNMHDENEAMMKRSIRLAFKSLLVQPSTLSDREATEMVRLAIVCDFFDFLECLVEYDGIIFQAVDAENGWTAFHLCVSRSTDRQGSAQLFRSMFERTDMDCFRVLDLNGRSVLHLAIENRHNAIVDYIVTENMPNHGCEVLSISIEYYYKLHEQPQSTLEDEQYCRKILRKLAKQITKIVLFADEAEQARHRSILQQEAKKLYQIAVKCSSLFLVNYLHREYGCTIDFSINDEDWLSCLAKCLNESNFQVFRWMIGQYNFGYRIANPIQHGIAGHISYDVAEKCEIDGWDCLVVQRFIDFFKIAEEKLSNKRSQEEVCIMRLVLFTVYLKLENATKFLCKTLLFTFDWKFLLDIIEMAHQRRLTNYCIFDSPAVEPIFRYLLQRITNLKESDASGRSLLHLAIELKLSCIVMLLIEHNVIQITTVNDKNGWNVIHYYASQDPGRVRCYTEVEDLVFIYLLKSWLENDKTLIGNVIERPEQRIIEHCFNNTDGRKNVIDVALKAGNVDIVKHILLVRLGIKDFNKHTICNDVEHANFKECYDVINQIASSLPLNPKCEYLLHRLAKSIDNFSLERIKYIMGQENAQDDVAEYARATLTYRSVSTLQHLIVHFNCEMSAFFEEILFSERELIVFMIECIRRHTINLFKMFVHRYCTIRGIQHSEVTFKEEENEENDEYTIEEDRIPWSSVEVAQLPEDDPIDRNHLIVFIMLAAYGRLSMARYFVEMLQPYISAKCSLLIMRTLTNLKHSTTRAPVYTYLISPEEDSDSEQQDTHNNDRHCEEVVRPHD